MSNRLTIKGQVTIPKAVRDFLGLQEGGSSVEFTINDDGSVTVRKACAAAEHTTAESVQTASASPSGQRAASALPLPAQLHIAACWHCSPAVFDWLPK